MLGKTVILVSFSAALYTGIPQVWNIVYLSIGISFLRWITYSIHIRRKYHKLVPELT